MNKDKKREKEFNTPHTMLNNWFNFIFLIFILINLFIVNVIATSSLKNADLDFNFWLYETQKNPNLSIIDRRLYEFDHFSARMPLQNQTILYDQLKTQLNHLLQHLNELCNDACMQQACKATDIETYVKVIKILLFNVFSLI